MWDKADIVVLNIPLVNARIAHLLNSMSRKKLMSLHNMLEQCLTLKRKIFFAYNQR